VKVRAKCTTVVFNIKKCREKQYRLYKIICVTFIQTCANIYDNPSYLEIMSTLTIRALISFFSMLRKATITFTVFVCLSVRYTSAYTGRIFLTFLRREGLFDYQQSGSGRQIIYFVLVILLVEQSDVFVT
jgi:hypothetical protein